MLDKVLSKFGYHRDLIDGCCRLTHRVKKALREAYAYQRDNPRDAGLVLEEVYSEIFGGDVISAAEELGGAAKDGQ